MQKADLRRDMLRKRLQYTPEQVDAWSNQICWQFFKHFSFQNIGAIHVFLPILSKNEVNTWFIIRALQREYPLIKIAVPVTNMQDISLSHYLLTPETKLVENKWRINEPVGADIIKPDVLNIILVPLLAFDEQGHRVGYGKGFYDRFLKDCKPSALKIGLSFEPPIPKILDFYAGDVVLDFVIMPTQRYSFK